jgi:alkylation response protein AidB-like acyl-CoA dehydrogenase
VDLGLSEAQEMLQRGAREALARECPPAVVRAVEARPDGVDRRLWAMMAKLGWLGLTIPEHYGGLGASLLDQVLLAEELGRALVPGPYVETCAILPQLLLAGGTEDQRATFLPAIAEGRLLAALALVEPGTGWDPDRLPLQGDAAGATIDCLKPFVAYAAAADLLILPLRLATAGGDVVPLLISADAPGVSIEPIPSLTGFALGAVRLAGVAFSPDRLVGPGGLGRPALHRALAAGAIIAAAYQVGMAAAVLDMTTAYAKNRVAFGQPIGAFQAIQHKLVGMLNDLDGAQLATREAAWRFDDGAEDAEVAAAVANCLASDGLRSTCFEAHEVHAGVGFMLDYDVQLFYRRAKWLEQFLGHPVEHRERVAAALLDR